MAATSKYDAIIIGAGPGGLVCSMLLAKAGVKVLILEKSSVVGGRTRLVSKDGFTFDRGQLSSITQRFLRRYFPLLVRMSTRNLNSSDSSPIID